MNTELYQLIDSLTETYYQVWEDLCNIESPSAYKEGVDAVGNYCVRIAEKRGWQVDICRQEVSGNAVCITLNPQVAAAPLAISGHMDTFSRSSLAMASCSSSR